MTKNPLALEKPNKHGPFYGYQRDGAGRFTCPKLGRVRTNFQTQLGVAASGFRGAKLNAWDVQHTREPPPTEGRPSPLSPFPSPAPPGAKPCEIRCSCGPRPW